MQVWQIIGIVAVSEASFVPSARAAFPGMNGRIAFISGPDVYTMDADEEAVPGDTGTVTRAITGSVRIFLGEGNGTWLLTRGGLSIPHKGFCTNPESIPFSTISSVATRLRFSRCGDAMQ